MMQFKKARLSLAMALALTGGMSANYVSADVAISADGLGQALIFPYYTVRDGQTSLFNITNTSDDTIAVKVRFRESHNSRDVLDFNLVLSPYDVWTGYLKDGTGTGNDGPILKSGDSSCTVPNMSAGGFQASNVGYTGAYSDGGSADIDRAREGYVEVIAMGKTETNTSLNPATAGSGGNYIAYNAKHVDGTPRDCATVANRFVSTPLNSNVANTAELAGHLGSGFVDNGGSNQSATNAREDLDGFNDGENPLKGNFTLLNSANGIAAGTAAIALTDFVNETNDSTIGTNGTVEGTDNLVTAQVHPYFLEPTLMSTNGIWSASLDVPTALTRTSMTNEWAANNKNGAQVDWVVTMPTKNFFVDYAEQSMYSADVQSSITENNWNSAMNSARNYTEDTTLALATTGAGLSTIAGFSNAFTGTSSMTLSFEAYDREENGGPVSGSTVVSPQPPGTSQGLDYEVNVLTFNGNSTLSSSVASNIELPSTVSGMTGWMSANVGAVPSVGFMFKKRDFGDSAKNYGQIINHGYTR